MYLCKTELIEIEVFWHLTECKQDKLYLYLTGLFQIDLF